MTTVQYEAMDATLSDICNIQLAVVLENIRKHGTCSAFIENKLESTIESRLKLMKEYKLDSSDEELDEDNY